MISHLGRYEILDELGQGAMGIVYKARDPLIDRVVAIKTINLSLALDEKDEYEGRFYQEAKAAGRLNHPNIVTIYDVGKSGDVAYIAMEFLEGRELRDILDQDQAMPVEQVLDITAQVALGLAYAHEHDIVHRDVKPSNIMVVRDGHVKITDFGIARMESAAVRTQTGMVLGSPKYMSPEQVTGKAIDQRSDIFSLGVMLYEMLTRQAPFTGENVNAIMYQTLNAIPPPPNTLNPAVPAMLNFIVAKALAKGLDDRYQDARELANDLRACRDSVLRSGAVPAASQPPAPSRAKLEDAEVSAASRAEMDAEESKPVATLGLSTAFDSFNATMKLAALTNDEKEVEEFSKTLKMARPSMDAINQSAAPAKPKPPVSQPKPQPGPAVQRQSAVPPRPPTGGFSDKKAAKLGGWVLVILAILVLAGLFELIEVLFF
jgi:eukaryotic-like serine/threonine-protein kinase